MPTSPPSNRLLELSTLSAGVQGPLKNSDTCQDNTTIKFERHIDTITRARCVKFKTSITFLTLLRHLWFTVVVRASCVIAWSELWMIGSGEPRPSALRCEIQNLQPHFTITPTFAPALAARNPGALCEPWSFRLGGSLCTGVE